MAKKQVKKKFRLNPAPVAGIGAMLLLLAFFNAQLITAMTLAYVTPASAYAQAGVVDSPNIEVDASPKITIPKIGVYAPVVYDMNSVNEDDVQGTLQNGVLHFGNSPLPGQPGNAVFVGHSSNLPWAVGDYKFVFMLLDKLEAGDNIYLDYNGTRYTYEVMDKKVVKPNDVSVLEGSLYPKATFITCTPLGTNTNRLVVSARQVHPDPTEGDEDALVQSAPELSGTLPGQGYSTLGKIGE